MTTRELGISVSALCFYDIGAKDQHFIAYANLALRTVYKDLCILGRHRLLVSSEGVFEGEKSVVTFDMREAVNDFQSFFLPPTDKNNSEINGAVFFDGILSLPVGFGDEVNISYRRLPSRILADYPDREIDLPEEYSELLTALCAYFICLEDDQSSAEEYKELYNRLLEAHKQNSSERKSFDAVRTNGWA